MTKKELAELILSPEELRFIDYALPQEYVDRTRDYNVPDVRYWSVWSYIDNRIFGQPLNLAELFIERCIVSPGLIEEFQINRERFAALVSTMKLVDEAINREQP